MIRLAALIVLLTGCAGVAGCNGSYHSPYHVTQLDVPALAATLHSPFGIALNTTGNEIFVADLGNCTVWKISAMREISSAVGDGDCASPIAGLPVGLTPLPHGLMVDKAGNLYIVYESFVAEFNNGIVRTIAGCGECGNRVTSGVATTVELSPIDVTSDSHGSFIIAANDCRLFKLSNGELTPIASALECSLHSYPAIPTTPVRGAPLSSFGFGGIVRIAVDGLDDVFVSDPGACRIWKVNGDTVETFAGDGKTQPNGDCASGGDEGPAVRAGVNPKGIAVDSTGNVFFSDTPCRVRMVDTRGFMHTVANNTCGNLASDRRGVIYVLNPEEKRIDVLEP